jgi:hypothetical protein
LRCINRQLLMTCILKIGRVEGDSKSVVALSTCSEQTVGSLSSSTNRLQSTTAASAIPPHFHVNSLTNKNVALSLHGMIKAFDEHVSTIHSSYECVQCIADWIWRLITRLSSNQRHHMQVI